MGEWVWFQNLYASLIILNELPISGYVNNTTILFRMPILMLLVKRNLMLQWMKSKKNLGKLWKDSCDWHDLKPNTKQTSKREHQKHHKQQQQQQKIIIHQLKTEHEQAFKWEPTIHVNHVKIISILHFKTFADKIKDQQSVQVYSNKLLTATNNIPNRLYVAHSLLRIFRYVYRNPDWWVEYILLFVQIFIPT